MSSAPLQQQQQQIVTGGGYNSTGEWGEHVYGSAGSQHAGVGNVIAMNGGRRRKTGAKRRRGPKSKRRGGYGMEQVLVPAALFAANYMATRKSVDAFVPPMLRSRRRRSGRRGSRRGRRTFRR